MTTAKTDLSLLDGADNILMGNDAVGAGIALNEAVAELRTLRKLVADKKPVCPHCKTVMKAVEYEGYYDSFSYRGCNCDALPEVEETWKGGYA